MNKRIRALAEQATDHANQQNELYGADFKTEYDKKFAELIVQDCIAAMGSEIVYNDNYNERNKAISDMLMLVKKHFGVTQ